MSNTHQVALDITSPQKLHLTHCNNSWFFSNQEKWKVEEAFPLLMPSMPRFLWVHSGPAQLKHGLFSTEAYSHPGHRWRFLAPRNSSGHPSALGSFQREAVSQVIDHCEPGPVWLMPESRQQPGLEIGPWDSALNYSGLKSSDLPENRRVSQLHKLKNSVIKS